MEVQSGKGSHREDCGHARALRPDCEYCTRVIPCQMSPFLVIFALAPYDFINSFAQVTAKQMLLPCGDIMN